MNPHCAEEAVRGQAHSYTAGEWRGQVGLADACPVPAGLPHPGRAAGALLVSRLELFRGCKPANPRPCVILCQLMGLTSELKTERAGSPVHALSVQIPDLLGQAQRIPFGALIT